MSEVVLEKCISYFRVRHCKVAVISESRNKQQLKKAIMISLMFFPRRKSADGSLVPIMAKFVLKSRKNLEKYRSTYHYGTEFLVWYSIFSMRNLIICGLCSVAFNCQVCHSCHSNLMPILFNTFYPLFTLPVVHEQNKLQICIYSCLERWTGTPTSKCNFWKMCS